MSDGGGGGGGGGDKTENGVTEIGTIKFCNFIRDFDSQYLNLVSYHHQLTDWANILSNLSNLCSENFISENGTGF